MTGRVLVVSPHLDDAVFSAGATMRATVADGGSVLVVTVFAGSRVGPLTPAARAFHRHSGLDPDDDLVGARRAEDRAALERLGVDGVHLEHVEGLYRWHSGRPVYRRRVGTRHLPADAEPAVVAAVDLDLATVLAEFDPGEVWTCGAESGHVDHRIVRRSVESVCRRASVVLHEWEDLPAAFADDAPESTGGPRRGAIVRPDHLAAKARAILAYRSQLKALGLGDDTTGADAFLDHAHRRHREVGDYEVMSRR